MGRAIWYGHDRRNDRAARCHGFDHDHTKWLFPFNRIEETMSAAEQIHFLPHIHRANILNLFVIDLRFNLLVKVGYRGFLIPINRASQDKWYMCLLCYLDRQMGSLLREKAP